MTIYFPVVGLPDIRFSMINKVATTHCSFLRLQINAVSVTKTEVYTILQPLSLPFIIENLSPTSIDARPSGGARRFTVCKQPISYLMTCKIGFLNVINSRINVKAIRMRKVVKCERFARIGILELHFRLRTPKSANGTLRVVHYHSQVIACGVQVQF
jgi:hypothetical protein